jgi:hypothetical protein
MTFVCAKTTIIEEVGGDAVAGGDEFMGTSRLPENVIYSL